MQNGIQAVIDEGKIIVSEGKMVGIILDLKRAFETIDKERLLAKMYQYGIRRVVLEFKSYLSNKTQQVFFNNEWSNLIVTDYGVPQRSVLGLLLFIVYINDIMKVCVDECNIRIFANDTLIHIVEANSKEVGRKLNMAFVSVEEWMDVKKLKMNVEKTKYMIVRNIRKELKEISR